MDNTQLIELGFRIVASILGILSNVVTVMIIVLPIVMATFWGINLIFGIFKGRS